MTAGPFIRHNIGTLAVTFIALASSGQQTTSSVNQAVQSSDVTFSSRTELVTVPVVVTGKKGKHLTGLKQSDFTIEENGHPRAIATFQEIVTSDSPMKASMPTFPLSNFASNGQEQRLVTIFVVDLLIPRGDFKYFPAMLLMQNIEALIMDSEKLTNISGYWPSFHDAEVLEFHFLRRHIDVEQHVYDFPLLNLKIHVWEISNQTNSECY